MNPVEVAYVRYRRILRAKCVRMLGEAEADDVVQETFLRFVRARDHGEPPDVALAWLYRVATRLAVDRLRLRTRHRIARGAVSGLSVADHNAAAEARDLMRLLAARVPARCLEAAILHRIDGLTHAEVAEICRCSPRTVRRLLRRFDTSARRLSR